uniref:HMG box domain-containing protein n=1 Tax=viral metagenome TaxID=1070528 RepID=A0A6C0DL45_9ZZZZ
MSSVAKFNPFASALKAAVTKINNIASEMDKKVDIFVDEVITKMVEYDEEYFTRGGNEETDKDAMKESIKGLFKMFQPEKKRSYSGYILYCKEERNNIKEKNPELSPPEITSALGAQWNALDVNEKAEYNAKAKSMKPIEAPKTKAVSKKKEEKKAVSKKKEEPKKKEEKEKVSKKKEEPKKKEAKKKENVENTIKKSPMKSPKIKDDFDFSGPASLIMKFKKINLDENTEGKRWRYDPETGLCFDMEEDKLVARYKNDELTWLKDIPENIKNWAKRAGYSVDNDDEVCDIELEDELSDDE